jgi:hypothetical protein
MWWDLFPTWGGHGGEAIQRAPLDQTRQMRRQHRREGRTTEATLQTVDDALLDVMARTLRLESEPCREGALHGLGHWHHAHPERTTAIVDEWLREQPRISPELHQYAMNARSGCVL